MTQMLEELAFFRGKRVLLTGHTGFKGAWMSRVLVGAGAEVTGYSLPAPTDPALFPLAGLEGRMAHITGDIRDFDALHRAFSRAKPQIVIHMAAQPIVQEGYRDPRGTYATNVMGTVNLLECMRLTSGVRSFLNVTTDKVYRNREQARGYREEDPLDGRDPYANSKSCAELVTHSYCASFFAGGDAPAVSTARAGNVIGGGDFARDRIMPHCVQAALSGRDIEVRNPGSVRPYQHVLEAVAAYLLILRRQWEDRSLAGWYNVGPDERDCLTTGDLVDLFIRSWGGGIRRLDRPDPAAPHEANLLLLDCALLRRRFGWQPVWDIHEAVVKTCEWTKVWAAGGDVPAEMDRQIAAFLAAAASKQAE